MRFQDAEMIARTLRDQKDFTSPKYCGPDIMGGRSLLSPFFQHKKPDQKSARSGVSCQRPREIVLSLFFEGRLGIDLSGALEVVQRSVVRTHDQVLVSVGNAKGEFHSRILPGQDAFLLSILS